MIRAALKNSSWLMSEKVVTMAVNLLVALLLARQLGPELFGELNYVLALVALVTPLSALGLNALIMRELVEHPARESQIMTTAAAVRLVGAAVGLLGLLLWAWLSPLSVAERVSLTVIGIAATLQAFQVVEYYFQANVTARYVVKMRATVISVAGVGKIAFALFYPSVIAVASVYALEFLAWGAGYVLLYKNKSQGFIWRQTDWRYGMQLLKQSSWLILSGIAAVLYLKIDQVMLGHLAGRTEVGVYAVAVKLSEVWYFFATAIATSFFAGLLALKKTAREQYQQRLQQLCDALFVVALVLAITVSLLADPVVPWLFGEEYAGAAAVLVIHIWASVFVFMRALASKWLIAERLLHFSLISHGIGAVLNIIANFILIPQWQGEGAAIATILSYACASYVAFWLSASTRPLALTMTRAMLLPFTLGYRYWYLLRRKG